MKKRSWEIEDDYEKKRFFDVNQAIDEINVAGYSIINDFLNLDQIEIFKHDLEKRFDEDKRVCSSAVRGDQMIVNNLPAYTRIYDEIIADKRILDITSSLLGIDSILLELRGLNMKKTDKQDIPFLHRDSMMSTIPGQPIRLVCLLTLDDMTRDNGATIVIPGTHQLNEKPSKKYVDLFEKKYLEVKRGTAIIMDANLWHGPSLNYTGKSRWILSLIYGRWFNKPYFEMTKMITEAQFNNLSADLKRLLGFSSRPPINYRERTMTVVNGDFIEYNQT